MGATYGSAEDNGVKLGVLGALVLPASVFKIESVPGEDEGEFVAGEL